ncbi:hypothetical protein BJ165DRAFT_1411389 [Panaeolus papilionaceus]|nr:hypothetical protein BJ165DRAFT_1411389 [Panaeolus papilionaceus]
MCQSSVSARLMHGCRILGTATARFTHGYARSIHGHARPRTALHGSAWPCTVASNFGTVMHVHSNVWHGLRMKCMVDTVDIMGHSAVLFMIIDVSEGDNSGDCLRSRTVLSVIHAVECRSARRLKARTGIGNELRSDLGAKYCLELDPFLYYSLQGVVLLQELKEYYYPFTTFVMHFGMIGWDKGRPGFLLDF